jgi:hypothetical protein
VHYFVNTFVLQLQLRVFPLKFHMLYKFVSNLRYVGGFLRVLRFPSPKKLTALKKTEILLKMAINQTKKLSPTLGCVMGPIFISLSNDISHVFSPVVSCPLQCSVCSSLFPFILFLGFALSVFFWLFPFAGITILFANDVRVV